MVYELYLNKLFLKKEEGSLKGLPRIAFGKLCKVNDEANNDSNKL